MGNIPKNRDKSELLEEFTKHARKSSWPEGGGSAGLARADNDRPRPGAGPVVGGGAADRGSVLAAGKNAADCIQYIHILTYQES